MFLKIINHSKKIFSGFPETKCYDCKKYLLTKTEKPEGTTPEEGAPELLTICIDVGEQHERTLTIPMKKHSVIIMNDSGKTIDRFSF